MGWSCRADAANILDAWDKACVTQTGMSNVYECGGSQYFFELSRTEHSDGAITGFIWRKNLSGLCRRTSTFRIEGDGTQTRAPSFLRKAGKTAKNVQAALAGRGYGRPMFEIT